MFRVDLRLRPEGAQGRDRELARRRSSATTRRSAGRGSARRGSRRAPCAGRSGARRARCSATLQPFVFPRLISPTRARRRPRPQPPDQARARAAAPPRRTGRLRPQERRRRHPRDRVLRPGAPADPRRQAARSSGAAGPWPRSTRCCSPGLVTDDEHRALIAGVPLAAPRRARAPARGRPPDPDRARGRRRRGSVVARRARLLADVERSRASSSTAHRGGVAAVRHARAIRTTRAPTSRRSSAATPSDADEAAALARLGLPRRHRPRAPSSPARAASPGSPLSPAATDGCRAWVARAARARSRTRRIRIRRCAFLGELIARRGAAWTVWRLLDENPAARCG